MGYDRSESIPQYPQRCTAGPSNEECNMRIQDCMYYCNCWWSDNRGCLSGAVVGWTSRSMPLGTSTVCRGTRREASRPTPARRQVIWEAGAASCALQATTG